MPEEPDRLIVGKEIQQLWAKALYQAVEERSRPWTREEVHAYLIRHHGVDSMKKVMLSWVPALEPVFLGEPVPVPPTDEQLRY